MKAAHPFMFIVVQMGRTKRATSGRTPRLSSAERIVTGRVAAELFVKRAISTAGDIALKTFRGFRPRTRRNSGRTTKNCMMFPPRITATYLPSEPTITPAVI